MRQSISSVIAALAAVTVSAAPALACGYGTCVQSYTPAYGGCATGCNSGWAFEHLAEPATQYYYVNQGPTYTGPGAFAPVPSYYEGAGVAAPSVYGYRWHNYHRHYWRGYHDGYTRYHPSPRYGYMPYYYGHRVLRRYY
jgi:hypothetical protein